MSAAEGTVFGWRIESEIPLRRLRPLLDSSRGILQVVRGVVDADGATVVHTASDHGSSFSIAQRGAEVVVECSLTGRYSLRPARCEVVVDGVHRDPDVIEHRLLSVVVPLLLSELGDIVLHGAAVAMANTAVVVVGPSGRGKSTFAAEADALGHGVLAEDGAVLEVRDGVPCVWPGPRGVRVADQHGPRRVLDTTAQVADPPQPVAAIVVLDPRGGGELSLRRVDGADALAFVHRSLMFAGRERLTQAFAASAALARSTPFYRCSFPDDRGAVAANVQRLIQTVTGAVGVATPAPRARCVETPVE